MSKSSALQRRVQCYPPSGLYKRLIHYAESHGMSKSEAAVYMMRCFLNPAAGSKEMKNADTAVTQKSNN